MNNKLRLDLEIIADLIDSNSRVLDVGCGDGSLIKYIKENKQASVKGIEIDNQKVTKAISKGLSVIQGDAENDLKFYPSNAADFVILSQTLQVTKNPKLVMKELLRISNYIIVSVPNFGYWENRFNFLLKGRMPVTKTLSYQWYDTPNIHFCTISDFKIFCDELNLSVEKQYFVNNSSLIKKSFSNPFFANIYAQYGIFLLKRGITVENDKKANIIKQKSNIAAYQ